MVLPQKEIMVEVDAQGDDSSNSRTSIAFLVIWVSVVEIWRK
jgi:hypothetical protein